MKIQTTISLFCLFFVAITTHAQTTDSVRTDDIIFEKVEQEAEFPGGTSRWRTFLEQNLNPNVPVDNGAPIGVYTILMQFVVDKNGNVSGLKALTNLGYGMEQEVMRILRKAGHWEPARQNGRAVNAYRIQPVTFQVEEDGIDVSLKPLNAGQDNEISVRVNKIKNEDLIITVSRGTIKPGADGKFIINVTGTQRLLLTISARKKNKELAVVSLEVKATKTETTR